MHNNSCPFSSYTFLIFVGFPDSSVGKESACSVGDLGSIPELGRSSGEGKGYPFQYSGLENPKFHTLYSPLDCKESHMTEQLSLSPRYLKKKKY